MPDGFAVPLFYLMAIGIWVFVKITTAHERQTILWWFWIAVLSFGGAGLLYTLITTGALPGPGQPFLHPQM